MPDPTGSRQAEIRTKLADYLYSQTSSFFPDINWLNYNSEHDTSLAPQGSIFIESYDIDREYPGNLDNITKLFRIHIILRLSKSTMAELLTAMDNWADEVTDRVVKNLQKDGFDEFFRGIKFRPTNSVIYEVEKYQTEGGKGVLNFYLLWEDHGFLTSQKFGSFI